MKGVWMEAGQAPGSDIPLINGHIIFSEVKTYVKQIGSIQFPEKKSSALRNFGIQAPSGRITVCELLSILCESRVAHARIPIWSEEVIDN